MMRQRRGDGGAAGGIVRGLIAACALVVAEPAAAEMAVTVDDAALNADIGTVPIADVLSEVARQTGAKLTIRGELGKTRPQTFAGVPLAEGLQRVVQPNGLILEFAPAGTGSNGRRLVSIRAVAPGATGGSPGMPQVSRLDPHRRLPTGMWSYDTSEDGLPPPEQRIELLQKISRSRGPATMGTLTYVLTGDPEPAVRRHALGLIGDVRTAEARQAVLQAAADSDPGTRAEALRLLVQMPGEKPVPLLAQAARGDGDPSVRAAAIELLSPKDGDVARAVLQGALADQDPEIREAAQNALRR